jgi:hypothetical protein
VITGEIDPPHTEIAIRLHHVDSTGVLTGTAVIDMGSGGWFQSDYAYAIASSRGSCIVIWSIGGWGALKAQRFNSKCAPLEE